ncbi:MAG TPA: TCR/Tet family MFS transporter [Opitutaceae bacterium]|nr:TCR/Tet family MFS transporter [Opitutaceae bacterium]
MRTPTGRPPAVGFVFVNMLLAVLGFGLVYPVLPALITEFRGGDVAASSHIYGWIVAIFAVMQFVGAPVLGALSDHFGRRRVILIATAGAAADYTLMALAPSLGWLFVARMIAGLTAGVVGAANAYLVDVTAPAQRAQAFGFLGAAFGLGFVLGPALGGLLGGIDLRLPFWAAAGIAALNCLWGALVLPESLPPERRRRFSWARANPAGALLGLREHPVAFGLAGVHLVFWIAQTMLHATWVLYTAHRYAWESWQVGLSLALAGLCSSAVQAGLVKPILARIGEKRGVLLGLSLTILFYIAYGLAPAGWMVYVIIVPAGLAAIAGPAMQTYLSRHVPADEQGAVQGAFASITSVAAILGQPLAAWSFGWAVAPGQPGWLQGIAFFEGAALMGLAVALARRTFRRDAAREAAHERPAVA